MWQAHRTWEDVLAKEAFGHILTRRRFMDLPRRQTRVPTWPVLTVFGFVAQPKKRVF